MSTNDGGGKIITPEKPTVSEKKVTIIIRKTLTDEQIGVRSDFPSLAETIGVLELGKFSLLNGTRL